MKIKRRMTLAIPIAAGEKAPTEIRLFAAGWSDSTKGMHLFDLTAAAEVMRAFTDWGNRITFYFDHPELDDRKPEDRKSAGSCTLALKGDEQNPECWAVDIQWADGIAEAIERKEWLYISPGFYYEIETRRICEIVNVALTNEPATKNARPLLMAASRFAALSLSHEEIRTSIQTALQQIMPEGDGEWNWVVAVYDDAVVWEREHVFWRVGYTLNDDGSVTLTGQPVEVLQEITFKPANPPPPAPLGGAWSAERLSVVPYKAGPIDDSPGWDAKAAQTSLRSWAKKPDGSIDWTKFRRGFLWYDAENPEAFGSYKLLHHEVQQGELTVSLGGVRAAGAVLMGARGGVDVPESDMAAMKAHLAAHYRAMDLTAPWDREDQQSSSRGASDIGAAGSGKRSIMDKAFLSALGLAETATETEALAQLTKVVATVDELKKLTGKDSASEALGVASGWKANADLVPGLQKDIADRDALSRKAKVEAILDSAPTKVPPAMRSSLLLARAYTTDDDVKWLEGHVGALPEHAALSGAGAGGDESHATGNPSASAAGGKKWAELSEMEKDHLYRNNRAVYDALKAEHANRGN